MTPTNINILLAILPVALYIGYINPMTSEGPGYVWTPNQSIVQLKASDKQYSGALAQLELVEKEIAKVDINYKTVNPEDKKKIGIMLADSVDQIKLRNEIVSLAAKKGVALSGLTVEAEGISSVPLVEAYKVNFSMRVRYPVFKEFIETYEKNMRFFTLNALTIARQDKDLDSSVKIDDIEALDITVSSYVYFLK